MENEEKEEPIGLLLHGERCDSPLWPSRRMENAKYTEMRSIAAWPSSHLHSTHRNEGN